MTGLFLVIPAVLVMTLAAGAVFSSEQNLFPAFGDKDGKPGECSRPAFLVPRSPCLSWFEFNLGNLTTSTEKSRAEHKKSVKKNSFFLYFRACCS
ncbi:MAG: hypothetical protein ACYTEQ_11495 [Planctomycetota bacterium]|jgi:hypothetical protein